MAWLVAFIFQIALTYIYLPSKSDFNKVETIAGLYSFDGGAVRTASTTRIGRRVVFCGVSVMGPESACKSALKNEMVTAKLVDLPTVFGPSPVVIEAAIDGKVVLHYTAEEQIKYWRYLSVLSAIYWSFAIAVGFFAIQQFMRNNKEKKGTKGVSIAKFS